MQRSTATLGVGGLLYFVAFRVEASMRTDVFASLAALAEERAAVIRDVPRFPIQRVLLAIVAAAFVAALARPVVPGDGRQDAALPPIPRRYAMGVAGAALLCAVTIALLGRV
jgi:hypothetical protein